MVKLEPTPRHAALSPRRQHGALRQHYLGPAGARSHGPGEAGVRGKFLETVATLGLCLEVLCAGSPFPPGSAGLPSLPLTSLEEYAHKEEENVTSLLPYLRKSRKGDSCGFRRGALAGAGDRPETRALALPKSKAVFSGQALSSVPLQARGTTSGPLGILSGESGGERGCLFQTHI